MPGARRVAVDGAGRDARNDGRLGVSYSGRVLPRCLDLLLLCRLQAAPPRQRLAAAVHATTSQKNLRNFIRSPPRRNGAAVRLHSFPLPRHVSGPEFAPRSRGRDSAPRRRAESRPAGCCMFYDLRHHLWIPLDSNGFHCSTRARFLAGSALRRTALQVPQRARDGVVPPYPCAAPRPVLGAVAG